MWNWLNSNSSAVQAFAAVITGVLTLVLAGTSFWYSRLTKQALELSRQQFQRHWQPDLSISLNYKAPYVGELLVQNVGNSSVTVTAVLLWPSGTEHSARRSYLVNQAVDAHTKEVIQIERFIADTVIPHGQHSATSKIRVGVDYVAIGAMGMYGYLEYYVRLENVYLVEVIPLDVRPTL